jgi:Flp pilus assembly pilin Flp
MRHKGFWGDDSGQDLIEYTLLLAMICLASAGLFMTSGGSVSTIWGTTESNLSAASTKSGS